MENNDKVLKEATLIRLRDIILDNNIQMVSKLDVYKVAEFNKYINKHIKSAIKIPSEFVYRVEALISENISKSTIDLSTFGCNDGNKSFIAVEDIIKSVLDVINVDDKKVFIKILDKANDRMIKDEYKYECLIEELIEKGICPVCNGKIITQNLEIFDKPKKYLFGLIKIKSKTWYDRKICSVDKSHYECSIDYSSSIDDDGISQ